MYSWTGAVLLKETPLFKGPGVYNTGEVLPRFERKVLPLVHPASTS